MVRILFAIVLLLAYLAAYLFIKYDNKRIEAECKFKKETSHTNRDHLTISKAGFNFLRGPVR